LRDFVFSFFSSLSLSLGWLSSRRPNAILNKLSEHTEAGKGGRRAPARGGESEEEVGPSDSGGREGEAGPCVVTNEREIEREIWCA